MALSPSGLDTTPQHGWYYWIYGAQGFLSVIASVVLYFIHYRSAPQFYRKQAFLMMLGSFLPIGARASVAFFGVDLFPQVDEVILFMLFSAVVFAVALFRYNALDLLPVAHRRIVQSIAAGIIVIDAGGRVIELNPFAERLTGMPSREANGKLLRDVLPSWGSLHVGEEHHEVRLERDGEEAYYSIQFSPIDPRDGGRSGYTLVFYDITARKQAELKLEKLARTDSLTGLLNRRTLIARGNEILERAKRYQRRLSLLVVDIDRFKLVNDKHGHPVGDNVLKLVAEACREQVRATDIFARYGGEEFVALLIEAGPGEALRVAERQRAAVETAGFAHEGQVWPLTISIGVAHYDGLDQSVSLADLIEQADRALYRAKEGGRNRVELYDPEEMLEV
jgi:diguanylate cyclase (GGDEF)-like protein/PAS domain S-box-containing protein